MDKQRESFERWAVNNRYSVEFDTGINAYTFPSTRFQYEGWQAAQADKLDFARKCLKELQWEQPFVVVSIDAIIAKVEQEQ